MLFSSFSFLFVFLPLTLATYWLARNRVDSISVSQSVILVASLIFIAAATLLDLALLLVSLATNWLVLNLLVRREGAQRRFVLATGIALNLCYIAAFKYADLISGTASIITGSAIPQPHLPLPLAIS